MFVVVQDGRLLINDQLLEVNGVNLAEKSNSDAMEALRLAMQRDGTRPGFIHVVVGRRPGLALSSPGTPTTELRISVTDPEDSVFPAPVPAGDAGAGGVSKASALVARRPRWSRTLTATARATPR